MKKKLPKIKPCPAGHEANSWVESRGAYIYCLKPDCRWSFAGLYRTARIAILAWNRRA